MSEGQQEEQETYDLASKQIKTSRVEALKVKVNALLDFLASPEQPAANAFERPFVEVSGETAQVLGDVKRVIRRVCYDHMLPIVKQTMLNRQNCCVTGTPGIGKTLFGLFLLREFIEEDELPVAYWGDDYAIFFSKDPIHIRRLSLAQTFTMDGKEWYIGCWHYNEPLLTDLLAIRDIHVVHDPAQGFVVGGTKSYTNRTAFILSFGHAMISQWATKRTGSPHVSLSMPFFGQCEVLCNKRNLFCGTFMTDDELGQKYRRFGGNIRHYGVASEADAWDELKAKVIDVAATGKGIGTRTTSHKGSIVHVWVDFDPRKPVFPAAGYNTFSTKDFILGSEELTLEFSRALSVVGRDQLKAIMNAVNGQVGAEAVYGALFEKYAHDMLCHGNRDLNIRVVRRDGKQKNVYASTTIPVNSYVHNFVGREASGISEALLPDQKISVGTYILPEASNFPTYDSAVVVPGSSVGLPRSCNVGLLLQMTVSGASGLRRRPKHSVKHYVREEMDKVLRETSDGAVLLSVTTFCVPTACFNPFDYQPELRKDTDYPVAEQTQAEYQFVIEIPGFTPLPNVSTPPAGIHGMTGRAHNYTLRERSKRARVEEFTSC